MLRFKYTTPSNEASPELDSDVRQILDISSLNDYIATGKLVSTHLSMKFQ